jgi:hypothetical protein
MAKKRTYNLSVDPSEKYDISSAHPEIIEKIMTAVRDHENKMVKGPDQLKDRG